MSFLKKASDWLSSKNARFTIAASSAFALVGSVFGAAAVTSTISNQLTRGEELSSTMTTLKDVFTVPVESLNGALVGINPAILEFGMVAGIVGGVMVGASKLLEKRKEYHREQEKAYGSNYSM